MPFGHIEDELLHFQTRNGIERTERLIQQEQGGFPRKSPGKGDALRHAAGELVCVEMTRIVKADIIQRGIHFFS